MFDLLTELDNLFEPIIRQSNKNQLMTVGSVSVVVAPITDATDVAGAPMPLRLAGKVLDQRFGLINSAEVF
jgi:hypothetical protein